MSAIFSDCGAYRYRLVRDLGMMGAGACCFVMLNPSTADATNDDPTIRRCVGFAKSLGCVRLEVVNIFAFRSTDPEFLYAMSKGAAIGEDNDKHIADALQGARYVICAWGNHGSLFGRGNEVKELIKYHGKNPMALKVNSKSKQPAHPLYLKADAQPFALV